MATNMNKASEVLQGPDLWGGWAPPLDQAVQWPLGRINSADSPGDTPWWQGRWKKLPFPQSRVSPQEMLWDSQYRTLRQFKRKQHFIVAVQTLQTHVQRLSPENKGVSPYISLQAGHRSKKQGLKCGYMQSYRLFYLTAMWLSLFSPTLCYVSFSMFGFIRFFSLCYAIPTSLQPYQNTSLCVCLLVLLPTTT
jgi:hypothetical protein